MRFGDCQPRGLRSPRQGVGPWCLLLVFFAACERGVPFTVAQRDSAPVPGFGGRVQVRVEDIKRGTRADVRVTLDGSRTLAQQQNALVGTTLPFDIEGRRYAIKVRAYENHTLRADLAHLAVLGLSEEQQATVPTAPPAPSQPAREADTLPAPPRPVPEPVAPSPLTEGEGSCGTGQPTVEERIADCAQRAPTAGAARARWRPVATTTSGLEGWLDAADAGAASSNWRRVTRTTSGREVWLHVPTRTLWSDRLGELDDLTSWCRARGERGRSSRGNCEPQAQPDAEAPSFAAPQVDPPESWCAEQPGFITPSRFDESKGGMRRIATPHSPSVVWSLPTAEEWAAAKADGAGSVVPHGADPLFWTTSVSKQAGAALFFRAVGAWAGIDSEGGAALQVRCVGRVAHPWFTPE
jgi:hypothetical protein